MAIVLVQTSLPHERGSMAAFIDLVTRALEAAGGVGEPWATCALFNPDASLSMWQQHVWRFQHAKRVMDRYPAKSVFHLLDGSMAGTLPRCYRSRLLVSVHDFIPVRQACGEWSGKRPSWPARWLASRSRRTIAGCRSVGANSRCTADDTLRFTGRPVDAVIPLAVRALPNTEVRKNAGYEPLLDSALQLPRRFIFHVGHNATYKNRCGVVDVFRHLRDMPEVELVMAGAPPDAALRARAEGLRGIHFLTDVDDTLLASLYARAALLLFPSLFEGYGMPVLEAMSAGCPVVCSNSGALPEVAGDAALMAPPADSLAMASACRRVLVDDRLRDDLIARGRIRAAAFTEKRMGEQLLDWYRRSADLAMRPRSGSSHR